MFLLFLFQANMQVGSGRRAMHFHKSETNFIFKILNCIGLCYFWGTLVLLTYLALNVYIPMVYEHFPWMTNVRVCLTYYFLGEVLLNYFMIIWKNSYFNQEASKAIPNSTWSHCLDCQAPKPPKTHHCPSCKRCILKRDHHCFLTATCIGFRNQRYMTVFAAYCGAAAIYGFTLCWEYCTLMYGFPFGSDHWYRYILPVATMEWIFGDQTFGFVFHVSVLYLSLITGLAGVGMSLMQFMFGVFGMTQKDYTSGITPDFHNAPVKENYYATFGTCFFLNFIIPMPWLKQKGDGIHVSNFDDKLI